MSLDQGMVFATPRLIIRAARVDDAKMFHDLWTDARVMANVGFPRGLRITRDEIEERIRAQPPGPFSCLLVTELKRGGERIGECHMHPPDQEGIAETDVKLLPAFWGQRFGVEIKRGLVDFLFTHTGCGAIQATPNVGNIASIKMQEAVGGVRIAEGVYEFPENMRGFTTPVHHYVYRLYRKDWERAVPR